jgi:hypothetical protein
MASEGRERNFDKALARHLRFTAASPRGACPDSEVLAAYHERSLLPEEMNSWKEHIVGCANCQTILAQLEATDGLPLPAVTISNAGAASPAKSRRALLLRGARWRWLAPAGALAAGLLVWIAWHENRSAISPNPADIKIAANQPTSSTLPSLQPEPAPPRPAPSSPNPQSVLDGRTRSTAQAHSPVLKQRQSAEFGAVVAPAKRDADKENGARKDAVREAPAELRQSSKSEQLDAATADRALQEKIELQTGNLPSQNQSNIPAPKAAGPALLGRAESKEKPMKMSPPAAPPQAVSGGVSGFHASTSAKVVTLSNPRLIPAPGSTVIWRAGRAGLLERSEDGGSSWSRQSSGVLVDLLTGAALSDKVCWVVGRVGAILLTTDGGAHWKTVASPLSEDLGGIHATDALHATIGNAKSTRTFVTSDGGATWKPVSPP